MNFDSSLYEIKTWKNPLMLHWILNPGIALNEVILGQKIPKVTLIEKNSSKSLSEKTFVPCPHCNTIHNSLKWSTQNGTAFKNWFGLYCDKCEKVIPCLTNLTSYLLLGLTFPIWYWFKDSWKKSWLENQKNKFSKPLNLTAPQNSWWKAGLSWGVFMFLFMTIIIPLLQKEEITKEKVMISIPIWTIGGLLFGYTMKKFNGSKFN